MRRSGRSATKPAAADRTAELSRGLAMVNEGLDQLRIGVLLCAEDGREVFRNQRLSSLVGDLQVDVLVARAAEEMLTAALAAGAREEVLELRGPPARSIKLVAAPLPSGGAIAYVEDASERSQLDAVRRDFVANVNHELRTPVGALGLLADALGEERDPAVVERLANRISIEADRARLLIEELLDFSKVETNDGVVVESITVASIVEGAGERVLAAADQVGVKVAFGSIDQALVVDGDREQLLSAVANLLDNALKYSEPAGPDVTVSVEEAQSTVDIIVADRGIGIPSRDLDRIFERFYRVDRARTRRTGGTGLGLAIVRHVATNHGGDVIVASTEGVGTTMTLRLPRSR